MSDYRRNFIPGGTYFFTVVAHERRPIFNSKDARDCLRCALLEVREKRPFDLVAFVLLPDHLHAIWTLPVGDADYSMRWAQIKENSTRHFLRVGGSEGALTGARAGRRERGVWQRRFWEHTCRDEKDLERCVDYLHWNPVKHGFSRSVGDCPWSSFHRFVRQGQYDPGWGRDVLFPGRLAEAWE